MANLTIFHDKNYLVVKSGKKIIKLFYSTPFIRGSGISYRCDRATADTGVIIFKYLREQLTTI